jgi:hypothetical protein
LLSNRRAPTKLAFALMLRFYALHGRFPKGRHEIPDQAVGYVARLVKVGEADLALYEWDGRTSKEHRKEIREYFGFRECGLADSDKAALWLAANVCDKERQPDRVREALLAHLWEEKRAARSGPDPPNRRLGDQPGREGTDRADCQPGTAGGGGPAGRAHRAQRGPGG